MTGKVQSAIKTGDPNFGPSIFFVHCVVQKAHKSPKRSLNGRHTCLVQTSMPRIPWPIRSFSHSLDRSGTINYTMAVYAEMHVSLTIDWHKQIPAINIV